MTFVEKALIEIIKLTPSLLWFLLIVIFFKIFYPTIRDELLPKLSSFEAGGVKLAFIKNSLEAAFELAEKSPQWKVDVPQEKREKAISRARKNMAVFRKAKFLWVDDCPENNLNERQMFQRLGAVIDLSLNTEDALKILERADYDLLISDMARGSRQNAGIDFLNKLKEKGNRIPLVFYIGVIDETKGIPDGAFGLTNQPDELLHLSLDVLERRYS